MTIASYGNDRIQLTRPGPSSSFFATANKEMRELQTTTAGAGYHAANHVYRQKRVDAIANLATATASDCALVATLPATNSTLAAVLTMSNSKLVTTLQDVSRITGTISELRRKLGNSNTVTAPEVGWDKRHYCWTCGYACEHSSCD